MKYRIWLMIPTLALGACTSEPAAVVDAGASPKDAGAVEAGARDAGARDAGEVACATVGPAVVSLETDDGETLAADLYTTGAVGGPAAVLLHMIPPSNDRSNYPRAFVDALVGAGITVLNVDRRGAGDSTGNARDAYTGPNGKFDPKAAVDFLLAHECGIDPTRVAIVGASNGTTSAVDYTVFAANDATWTSPKALVFLTGGTYTESQNRISEHRATFDALPVAFVYSTAERAWSVGYEPAKAASWTFLEYDPGAHGTRMFQTAAQSIDDVAAFLETNL